MRLPRSVLTVVLLALVAGSAACTDGGGAEVFFLEQPNRIRHLVAVVPAARKDARAVLGALLQGPPEADRGLSSAIPAGSRLLRVSVSGGSARVFLSSPRPWRDGFYATAQVVYTLTGVPGIERVILRVNGRRCCVYNMHSRPWRKPLTRALFVGWQGEPVRPGT